MCVVARRERLRCTMMTRPVGLSLARARARVLAPAVLACVGLVGEPCSSSRRGLWEGTYLPNVDSAHVPQYLTPHCG